MRVASKLNIMFIRQIHRSICVALLGLALRPAPLTGAEPSTAGREIYRKQCANCHGKKGEGVKGKYDDVLHGDWSLEKLTRYIDKNMPEDAPEKCVGADAAASKLLRCIQSAIYLMALMALASRGIGSNSKQFYRDQIHYLYGKHALRKCSTKNV